jgi:serine/threonine-protein kinase
MLAGAVLSRAYRLSRKLGDGGMGEVYAAESLEDGRKVAIKLIHHEFMSEPVVLQRFAEEAATCQRLVHPNIVRVYEARTAEDGSPYMVMELLEGVPLSAYTQNGGRVAVTQAIPIVQGILAALSAAHAQGIVHRDLKPENVFLARDASGRFLVKVLDFGIAKVMDAAGGMGSKTRTGVLLGTPAYMSPEQIKNAKDVDARADLWSAGVMFYEMLTGKVAFPAPTEYARLTAVLTTTPEPMARVDAELGRLDGFVDRALQKDRALRFQTASEMSHALASATGTASVPPLSRLPDVPSLFGPDPRAPSAQLASAQAALQTPAQPTTPLTIPATNVVPVGKTPGGTLTSPAAPHVADVVPQVLLMPAAPPQQGTSETLPSQDLPMLAPVRSGAPRIAPKGVSVGLVVVLVTAALAAGFLIGFAVARMT